MIAKTNHFQGDVSDVSAETATLIALVPDFKGVWRSTDRWKSKHSTAVRFFTKVSYLSWEYFDPINLFFDNKYEYLTG